MPNKHFLVIKQHAIHGTDGGLRSLGGLIMDKTISFGIAVLICGNLAREYGAEGSEGVVKSLSTKHDEGVSTMASHSIKDRRHGQRYRERWPCAPIDATFHSVFATDCRY